MRDRGSADHVVVVRDDRAEDLLLLGLGHLVLGRALWIRGVQRESFAELERSIELSPNFALGHYTLGFVHSQTGDPRTAIDATDYSRELSPFDPLQFAMLASRAVAHVRLGELEEAADWAVKATGRPNAHAHILAIATECLALTNRHDEARAFASVTSNVAPRAYLYGRAELRYEDRDVPTDPG